MRRFQWLPRLAFTSWSLLVVIALHGHASADPARPVEAKAPAATAEFRPYQRPVTTWVPAYAVAKSFERLKATPGAADALTHLGLQFWVPTRRGGVELLTKWESNDAAVAMLRDWGHAHGVRVMLCVYNAGGGDWDWPLARAAFAEHRAAFAAALVADVERHGLDGVDLDLEGPGDFETDRPAFVAFVKQLSAALHAKGKHLTVDTFPDRWNAPNQTWWPDLLPHVDGLASMGYEEIGANAERKGRRYADQRDAAGAHAAKLQIGMPSGKGKWQGNAALEQLKWVQTDGKVGVAIWDAQFRNPAWRTSEVWAALKAIRGK